MIISIGEGTKKHMKVLGIIDYPFTVSFLKSSYRSMSMKFHPDLNEGKDTTEDMKKVNLAFSALENLAIADTEKVENVFQFIPKFKKSEDIFELTKECDECFGKGIKTTIYPSSRTFEECPDCNKYSTYSFMFGPRTRSTGIKTLACHPCGGTGIFKQRNGREVPCNRCYGTGKFEVKCRTCKGTGRKVVIIPEIKQTHECYKCGGMGRIKLNLFNPVIRKGAVL